MHESIRALAELLRGRRVAVLTGAGASTESGIPDYRGPQTRGRAKNPVQYRAFVGDEGARRRYWARAVVGWSRFSAAEPNAGHLALVDLERAGAIDGIITQNVDGLHQAAGSRRVIELHGALARVRCLSCGAIEPRAELQRRLVSLNPRWDLRSGIALPDGDADLERTDSFRVAACRSCAGVLKPDVVFFGESVPRVVVETAYAMVESADALLVVGSSLAVFSGYRFVRRAAERCMPIAMVNLGPARGDDLATLRIERPSGEALPALARELSQAARRAE